MMAIRDICHIVHVWLTRLFVGNLVARVSRAGEMVKLS